jgi:hypothetical protein
MEESKTFSWNKGSDSPQNSQVFFLQLLDMKRPSTFSLFLFALASPPLRRNHLVSKTSPYCSRKEQIPHFVSEWGRFCSRNGTKEYRRVFPNKRRSQF